MRKHFRNWLVLLTIAFFGASVTFAVRIVDAQTTSVGFCPERTSEYRNGVLIYECEIVEREGQYFVVERDTNGITGERAADAREVAEYLTVTAERACITEQRSAVVALSTPARDSTLTTLAERVQLIESAIRKCVE